MKFGDKLYFITDSKLSKNGVVEDVDRVLEEGCKTVQYREKSKTDKEIIGEAERIKKKCEEKEALFLIDDRVDIALVVDSHGVHLGQDDMPVKRTRKLLGEDKIIGKTTKSVEQAVEAEKQGADYVSIGPIFGTKTKKDACEPKGVKIIRKIKNEVGIPVVAIGGINLDNIKEVLKADPDCIAMISGILKSENVKNRVENILGVIHENQ